MPYKIESQQQKLSLTTPKHQTKKYHDSFRSDKQKYFKTQQSQDQQIYIDSFGKTHFKQKLKDLQLFKQKRIRHSQINHKNCLQKIQQKLKKHSIITQRNTHSLSNSSQLFKFHALTTKNTKFNHKQSNPIYSQPKQISPELQYRPLTLKKKINMIRKHKQELERQFLQRKASLEYDKRALAKQQYRLQTYKQKFNKVRTVRQQRYRQRTELQRQKQMHDQEIYRQNCLLRDSVLGGQQNLRHSRLSLSLQKIRQANQTRAQKTYNNQQAKTYESLQLKRKKQQCQQIKNIKYKTQQSVELCNKQRKLTVNQQKLLQISQQLITLEQQKKSYSTFYKTNQLNDTYQNKIKNKKIQLQQKAKLNKSQKHNASSVSRFKNQQQQSQSVQKISRLKQSTNTEGYRKKRYTISTVPDLNFIATKSNSIYKRKQNSNISNLHIEQQKSKDQQKTIEMQKRKEGNKSVMDEDN